MFRAKVASRILEQASIPRADESSRAALSAPKKGEKSRPVIAPQKTAYSLAEEPHQPVVDLKEKKDMLDAQIRRLGDGIGNALAAARIEFMIFVGSLVVTIVFTVAGKVWSNDSGMFTTFIAGGTSTGIVGATSAHLLSFFTLKYGLNQDVTNIRTDLDANNLQAAEDGIKALRARLTELSKGKIS